MVKLPSVLQYKNDLKPLLMLTSVVSLLQPSSATSSCVILLISSKSYQKIVTFFVICTHSVVQWHIEISIFMLPAGAIESEGRGRL